MKLRLAVIASLAVAVGGCGTAFVDTSVVTQAKADANRPGLTQKQRGKIFEDAGDAAVKGLRKGFAADLWFDAANAYNTYDSTDGDADVQRVYRKCVDNGLDVRHVGSSACSDIKEIVMDDWDKRKLKNAQSPPAKQSAENTTRQSQLNSAQPETLTAQMDDAITKARSALATAPSKIDGCPTNVTHLADRLPVCPENMQLQKLRELSLATDASFREDVASGLTLAQVATRAAEAARMFDATLAENERIMRNMASDIGPVERRLRAIRSTPAQCDAHSSNSLGMQEAAYQAYVASYIAAQVNRAVSAIAACRARASR
tara:strand:+ start:1506 stop:2456 length:951 start_codon:yes stop_codon:yes gene_type:complete